jgi:pimeloyl-ACP methyl ester carboxylesterase
MQIKTLSITNREGIPLAARLDMPGGTHSPVMVLYAHCFTCNKNLKAAAHLSRGLVAQGLAVCRFDFTGLGESAGAFSDTTFSSNVNDLEDVATFLKTEYTAPQLIIGHSLGGAAVIQAASRLTTVRAVVTIGAPADPRHVLDHLSQARPQIESQGQAPIQIDGRTFIFKAGFIKDLDHIDQKTAIRELKRPLLVMHAPLDDIVSIDNAGQIFQTARHPKSFISLDGADHLLSDPDQARYAGELIAAWASKYMRVVPAG